MGRRLLDPELCCIDNTELIEPWIGLGLMVATFILALWLLPTAKHSLSRRGYAIRAVELAVPILPYVRPW